MWEEPINDSVYKRPIRGQRVRHGPHQRGGHQREGSRGKGTVASNEVRVIGLKYVMSCDKWKAYYSRGCQISVTQSPHLKRSSTESVRNCKDFLLRKISCWLCSTVIMSHIDSVLYCPSWLKTLLLWCHNFPNSCLIEWFDHFAGCSYSAVLLNIEFSNKLYNHVSFAFKFGLLYCLVSSSWRW